MSAPESSDDPVSNSIIIWTDGSCLGNPGPGGWAYIIQDGEQRREAAGHARDTTNNRMEMTAAIEALNTLNVSCDVVLHSDSQLLIKTMTLDWKRKKNHDLWAELDRLSALHRITWRWVRGHNGHPENEACDALAQRATALAGPGQVRRPRKDSMQLLKVGRFHINLAYLQCIHEEREDYIVHFGEGQNIRSTNVPRTSSDGELLRRFMSAQQWVEPAQP